MYRDVFIFVDLYKRRHLYFKNISICNHLVNLFIIVFKSNHILLHSFRFLQSAHGTSIDETVIPQIKDIVTECLLSVQEVRMITLSYVLNHFNCPHRSNIEK